MAGAEAAAKEMSGTGVPVHVALIMDGNGRWAARRGLPRIEGHRRGVQALRDTVRHAGRIGVRYLTIFAFSSENWTRPDEEVSGLMGLLKLFIRRDLAELAAAGVRIRVIGERRDLPRDILSLLEEAEATTAANQGLTLVVAFNYGARNEIARAARALAREVASGRLAAEAIDEASVASHLDTVDIPDPDLIIRTSGEERLSNFLLWQAAYAELVFLPVLWPDFSADDFDSAIRNFLSRERRFGGLAAGAGGR